jgi:metallo-beta-lactamase family protein
MTFLGAAGEVTGSCTLIEHAGTTLLVDCGMFQGSQTAEAKNRRRPTAFDPRRLDAVVLTHAHLDHCGRLPFLVRLGMRCPIFATPASIDLAALILKDSAKIQADDAERAARRRARVGRVRDRDVPRPLYDAQDVERTLALMRPVAYGVEASIAADASVRFTDAGHILGSASARVRVGEGAARRVIAFSGDIGVRGTPLLRDPVPIEEGDALVLESTYGDREHKDKAATLAELKGVLRDARATPAGRVVIPAFAVGRTQNLVYHMAEWQRAGEPVQPVVVDSPMAVEATELYRRHRECFDDEAWALIADGHTVLDFASLGFSRTAEESKAINDKGAGIVIISAPGMATGGRVVHHLRHSLGNPAAHVVIVGWQAPGTLGRRLVDREPEVVIYGERIGVRAHVHTLGGLSAHAGQADLVGWCEGIAAHRPRVYLNHGEAEARAGLAAALARRHGLRAQAPAMGEVVPL